MKRGVALIELIIAIVVMAITFSAVPLIMEVATQSTDFLLRQEAVSLASTQMSSITKLMWDEAETNETLNGGYAKIVDVADNTNAPATYGYGRYGGKPYRIGAVTMGADEGSYRRKFYNDTVTASTSLGPESGESDTAHFDDVDDFNGLAYQTSLTGAGDYKLEYNVTVAVSYHNNDITSSSSPSGSSNIKVVTVQVSEGINDTNISLWAFLCNIGETKILTRYVP